METEFAWAYGILYFIVKFHVSQTPSNWEIKFMYSVWVLS